MNTNCPLSIYLDKRSHDSDRKEQARVKSSSLSQAGSIEAHMTANNRTESRVKEDPVRSTPG
jgi:hypothetical protein